jgi:hypothetical protein
MGVDTMSVHRKHASDERNKMVRVLAAYDRESEQHKKIYEDLAEE